MILQRPQQFGLSGQRHVTDLVQKQRAAVSELDQAHLIRGGAGKRVYAAKQPLKQGFDHRRTIAGHEAALVGRARLAQRLGYQVLAGSRLPRDERGAVVRRHRRMRANRSHIK